MLRILSIVSTQMQLVNCIEYIKKHNSEETINKLVICYSSEGRKKQMLSLLSLPFYQGVFSEVELVTYGASKRWLWYLKAPFLKLQLWRIASRNIYDTVIIGNYKSMYHRYTQFLCWNKKKDVKLVLVDDGTATADTVVLRAAENEMKCVQPFEQSRFLERFYYALNKSFKSYIPTSLIYFSVYRNLNFHNNDSYEECDYHYLKSQFDKDGIKRDEGGLAIVGQFLSEEKILTKDRYNDVVLSFINKHDTIKALKPLYVPHPVEDYHVSLRSDVLDRVQIKKLSVPFEMWVIANNVNEIVGFYSSALINIRTMFPDIQVYSLCPKEIRESKSFFLQEAREAYKYNSLIGIKVIDC